MKRYDKDLLQIYADSFRDNWDLPALTDYATGDTMTYAALSRRIAGMHMLYEQLGVRRGDKVALMGRNTSMWVVVFMATVTYGAVIVPVLQDFNPRDAQHIINHSDADLLFVSESIWESQELERMPRLKGVISLDSQRVIAEPSAGKGRVAKVLKGIARKFGARHKGGFRREDVVYHTVDADAVAVINYTSGT
ncbi:MAG: AMP-binding protein, partial [Muribaculaceae bacterium]|nr:AMP-binding protein [Muribaculaceae bacterium]